MDGTMETGSFDRKLAGYWVFTALFAAAMLAGAIGNLTRSESMATEIVGLGYPAYLMTILGVAKLSGALTLLAPGLPRLKEWAYAGFTFDLLGATASHAIMGDPIFATIKPLIVLALAGASYALAPESRRLSGWRKTR